MGNNSASILARLKNESIKRGIPNQQMITLFLQEEFSRRLGKSKYIDKFVLKGGFLWRTQCRKSYQGNYRNR